MSTKPPISSLGSAPLMNFSSPAASTPLIQSRRSLLAMLRLHYPDDRAIVFFHYRALKFGTFSPDAFELDIGLIRRVEHQSIWMPTDPITPPRDSTLLPQSARRGFDTYTKHACRTQ